MLELGLAPIDERELLVEDEPALEIALPQVFDQPALTVVQRGKLANPEALVAKILRSHQATPNAGLGPDYQELVNEFQPLFTWATACWDFLLSTEGCRFLPRNGEHRYGVRGDYRAFTDKDYSRLVHALFRACVFEFAQQPAAPSLAHWLRERLWPLVLDAYQRLQQPADPRQRILTPYSYLRCIPYQFLNDVHQDLVYPILQRLPAKEWQAMDAYFLRFCTESATADALGCSSEECVALLRHTLVKLLIDHRLVYCLLRQIERY